MNKLMLDKELIAWAMVWMDLHREKEFLLLEMECCHPVHIIADGIVKGNGDDTTCRIHVTPVESTIEIESTADLSLFMRPEKTRILYVLGDTAFVGYLLSAFYDSANKQYALKGDVAALRTSNKNLALR